MSTVSLNPALTSQKWNLGRDLFSHQLSVTESSPDNLEIVIGSTGDVDLKKVGSAFGAYLSAPERAPDDLAKRLIVAHNAGEIFGKIANHNQKIYDSFIITIFHVILAVLTFGIFSLRSQYTIEMPKADLLSELDFTSLSVEKKDAITKGLSLREFFLLDPNRQKAFLDSLTEEGFLPGWVKGCCETLVHQEFDEYLESKKKLPLEMQAAMPLSLFIRAKSSQVGFSEEGLKLIEMSDADFLKVGVDVLQNLSDQEVRIVAARLKHLSKECDAQEPCANLNQSTLANLSRFSPEQVTELFQLMPRLSVAYALFPRDLFFKAIFSKEVLADGVAVSEGKTQNEDGDKIGSLSKNAREALSGFFADYPFLSIDDSFHGPKDSSLSGGVSATPMKQRASFADQIKDGGLKAKVHIDNPLLHNELRAYFGKLLLEANAEDATAITSIFKAFAGSNDEEIRCFFQVLSAEVLDKCDWRELPSVAVADILWDYNQDRFMALSEENRIAILNNLGIGKVQGEIGDFRVPELLPDAFWKSLPALSKENADDTKAPKAGESLFVCAQQTLFSPSGVNLSTGEAARVREYHLRHWELIGVDAEGEEAKAAVRTVRETLIANKAFPKEWMSDANPVPPPVGGKGGAGASSSSSSDAAASSTTATLPKSSSTGNLGGEGAGDPTGRRSFELDLFFGSGDQAGGGKKLLDTLAEKRKQFSTSFKNLIGGDSSAPLAVTAAATTTTTTTTTTSASSSSSSAPAGTNGNGHSKSSTVIAPNSRSGHKADITTVTATTGRKNKDK